MSVRDDGIGAGAILRDRTRRSLGTTLVETMVSRLNGKIEVEGTGGTATHIELDLPEPDAADGGIA
jgi:two-component sensor histidine kinase